jgi:archaellum component FlaC
MALLKFKKGLYANLPATKAPGTVYITTDEKAMYVDLDETNRIRIGQIINTTSDKLTPPFSTESFYYLTDINALVRWDGVESKWVQLNSTEALRHDLDELTKTVGALSETVAGHGTAISGLQKTVGDSENGLVKDLADLASKVDDLEAIGGQANIIEKITINGTEAPITDKTVALGKLAGVDAKVAKTDLDTALKDEIDGIALTAGAAKGYTDEKIAAVQNSLNAFENQIGAIPEDKTLVETIEERIATSEADTKEYIDGVATGINGNIDAEIAAVEEQIAAVASDLGAFEAKIGVIPADKTFAEAIDETFATKTALTELDNRIGYNNPDPNKTLCQAIEETYATKEYADEKAKAAHDAADAAGATAAANAQAIKTINETLANKVNTADFLNVVGENGTLTKRVTAVEGVAKDAKDAAAANAQTLEGHAATIQGNTKAIADLNAAIGNLTNVMNFRGVSSTDPTAGVVTVGDTIIYGNADPAQDSVENGDVVIYGQKEYVYSVVDGTGSWIEFGDGSVNAQAIARLGERTTALETTVGDSTKGLVKAVADNTSAISGINTTIGGHADTIAELLEAMTWGSFDAVEV